MNVHFMVQCVDDYIWNMAELIYFLNHHQNQSIILTICPEAICLQNLGLYKILDAFNFAQVTIRTQNPFEYHAYYKIKYIRINRFLNHQPTISPQLHTWTKNKVFLAFYGRPTAARLGLAGYLYANYKKISHLHFSTSTDLDTLPLFEMNKLFCWSIKDAITAGHLVNNLPLLLTAADNYNPVTYDYNDLLTLEYQHGFVDIVVESHVAGNTFFPTEKTARPMWLKKPFIIFGPKDYLVYLRQLGFKTFYEFWDEDYDGYDCRDRLDRIKKLIDDLAKKSSNDLEDMYQKMQGILDHNHNLLMTQTYTTTVTKIV